MVHLERSVATLRIMGDELVPEEISRLLSAMPTSAHVKGPHWHEELWHVASKGEGDRARRLGWSGLGVAWSSHVGPSGLG